MMTIPSVEPISEMSFGFGVDVGCIIKNAAALKVPSRLGGVKEVRAALNSARRDPSPTVMIGRINFFIRCLSVHVL